MILMVFISTMTVTACGQKTNVPAKVKTAFEQKFPTAKKVKWDKENEIEWEAEFKMNSKEYSANFNSDGKWMETEYEIKKSDIPSAVKSSLDSDFKGYKIEEAEISETADGKVYEFELEKGKTDIEVAISTDGSILKKEEKKENDENGEEDEEKDND